MSTVITAIAMMLCLSTLLPPGECLNIYTARIDEYGTPMTLTCTERQNVTFDHWLLPDLHTIVEWPYHDRQVELLANKSLYIASVEKEHLGDYICRVIDNDTGEPFYYRTTLYLYIPTVWEIYRHNVIVGCSAAGVALVFFIIICTVDRCRYSTRQLAKKQELWLQDVVEVETVISDTSQGAANNGYGTAKYLAPDGSLTINTAQL